MSNFEGIINSWMEEEFICEKFEENKKKRLERKEE